MIMARESISIDVSRIPELLRIAEEVGASGEPQILRRDHENLAVVMPMGRIAKRGRVRMKTDADIEVFESAAGGWKDIDTDKLVEEIYDDRRRSVRPPLEL